MAYTYKPSGICAGQIDFDVKDGKVEDVRFYGGCPGNHIGIQNLVNGMPVDFVIERLKGIRCGNRMSSCPDQLAKALEEHKKTQPK